MNKKTAGMLVAIVIIGLMIVLTVKSNIKLTGSTEDFERDIGSSSSNSELGLSSGEVPPDFELTTVTGKRVKLSDYEGKKVILNFWASWCPPCKAEMPHMENYYKANKDLDNVEILAVNMTTTERRGVPNVEKFVNGYGLTFPVPLDAENEVTRAYKVISPPTTYIINTDGTISHKESGPLNEELITELIQNAE